MLNQLWCKITGKPPRRHGTSRGKKRKLSSLKKNPTPVAHHMGHRKLSSNIKTMAASSGHSGKKRRLGSGLWSGGIAHNAHSGKKRRLGSGLWSGGLAHEAHSGQKRKRYKVRAVDKFSHNPHQGKKRKKNPAENSKALIRQRHQGRKRRMNEATWVGVPHNPHSGNRHNKHNESSGGLIPHVPHSGSRKNRHGITWEGYIHKPHQGSGRNKHKAKGFFGVPHVAHQGNKKRHNSANTFGIPHVSHSGTKTNQHKGFRGYFTDPAYSPGLLSSFLKPRHNHAKVPAYQRAVKYKVKSKRTGKPVVRSNYSATAKKYKPKQKIVSTRKRRNATALRMKKMAYLHKSAKGKKRKLDDRGKYQGHVSFNQFLRAIILILSILVAISLFFLVQTRDAWMEKETENLEIEENLSISWEICQKKNLDIPKEL